MTKWAAYACRLDDKIGSIEVGKLANFTVLSEDMMTAYDRGRISNIMTISDGNIVFSNGTISLNAEKP